MRFDKVWKGEIKVGFYYNTTCYQLQEKRPLYNQYLNNNKGNHPNKETIIIMKLSNNNNIIYVNIPPQTHDGESGVCQTRNGAT